jgi:tetratricopeptide (TPR) repeat protein
MNQQQFEAAASQFRDAIALDAASENGHLNLGLALLALSRNEEAEASVRRALEVSPRSIAAYYALGQVLYSEKKNTTEALETLQKAAAQFPHARLLLAHMLLVRGAVPDAANELRQYLESGLPEKRQEVQAWLDQLTRTIKGPW